MKHYGQEETVEDIVVGTWEAVQRARTAKSFMNPESGIPILQAQFNSYRNFFWVSGLLALMQQSAERATCCTEWAREFGLPDPDIIIDLTKDMQRAWIQGLVNDYKGATTDEMTYWYAEIITNREERDARTIKAIQEGQIPITQTEKDAAAQANIWKEMIVAGGEQRIQALAEAGVDSNTGAIKSDWATSVPPADSVTSYSTAQTAPVALKDPGKVLASDVALSLDRFNVSFAGWGSPEVPYAAREKTLALSGTDIAKVAAGGVGLYLLLQAFDRYKK